MFVHRLAHLLQKLINNFNFSFNLEQVKTYCSKVGVEFLSVQATIVLDVLEGLVHESTIAALISFRTRAVNQVLLTEGYQFASLSELLTLHGSSCAEGPARTTLTLKEQGLQ